LFRFTVKHSFYMLLFISVIVLAQAYWFKWLIPSYDMMTVNKILLTPDSFSGFLYLSFFAILLTVFGLTVNYLARTTMQRPKVKV
jgi:lactate permease